VRDTIVLLLVMSIGIIDIHNAGQHVGRVHSFPHDYVEDAA
jgi:hypothetical protein